MVRNMTGANRSELRVANEERIRDGDLIESTLDDDIYVPVFQVQSDRTTRYAGGHGPSSRQHGTGWADLDLATGAGGDINGKARWEVYRDSSKEDLKAVSDTFRLENLRSAVAADRTEKVLMPQRAPVPPQDGYLVLAVKADSGNDGDTVDQTEGDVDVGVPYSRMRV